jgi:lipoprotein
MKYLKRLLILYTITIALFSIQSCYVTQHVNRPVSMINDLNKAYIGKTKSYIIETFPYTPTENKRLNDQYELLIFKRYRNNVVGYGITTFLLKDGRCSKIETNEYKIESRLEKVSIFECIE